MKLIFAQNLNLAFAATAESNILRSHTLAGQMIPISRKVQEISAGRSVAVREALSYFARFAQHCV